MRSIVYDPLGVALATMPWKYSGVAAGNATLLKHTNNVPESAIAVEKVLARAGTR